MKVNFFSMVLVAMALLVSGCDSENENAAAQNGQSSASQEASVSFITLEPQLLNATTELPGRIVSYQVAEIRPQVSGIIQSRLFEEGSFVEEGQQLYQIDPARYQASYDVAMANLQNAQARLDNAQNLSDRYERLVKSKAVSEQEFDDATAELNQAKAAVALAEAEVQTAKINLDYTKVYAPISGYISPSGVTKGALVTAQQENPLATIRQLDPVYVDLSQSASTSGTIQASLMKARMNKNAGEGEISDEKSANTRASGQFKVTLFMPNTGEPYSHTGILDATDLAVDEQTGSIRLRSVFPNPDIVLLPGMFVRATIEDTERTKSLIVPQRAVQITPDGNKSLWIIDDENKAQRRIIRTDGTYKNNWIVIDGVQDGDKIIVEGTMMLREGTSLNASEMTPEQSGNQG
ncbi:MAG: efflux RND transporter periplasmic adaptor subunit [Alphaproteobacteria bacterium]